MFWSTIRPVGTESLLSGSRISESGRGEFSLPFFFDFILYILCIKIRIAKKTLHFLLISKLGGAMILLQCKLGNTERRISHE